MATRVVKVRNMSGSDDTWVGQLITDGSYYQVQSTELVRWANSDKVFTDIGSGALIVNTGEESAGDLVDPVEGWRWLVGDTEPPRTVDGDWHIVAENFAHVTGNNAINWTVEKCLDAGTSYSEKFIVPNGRTFTLNFMEGGAFTVPTHIVLAWYEDLGGGTFMRRNPEIRLDEIMVTTVDGAHSQGDTMIVVSNTNNELDMLEPDLYYGFKDGLGDPFYRKVVDIFPGSNTIQLETGLPAGGISDGTYFGLTDRVIGQKANQIASSIINWISPPRFYGNGTDYLEITITNEDSSNPGLVTALVNGWHTDSVSGD